MSELFRDKEANFNIESLKFFLCENDNIPNEDIEFINKISPKILKMDKIIWTVENIKAVSLLKCTHIEVEFNNEIMLNFDLSFKNTQILLFESKSDQMLTFEWKSINLLIDKNKIENVKLRKVNAGTFLFIPLDTIHHISCSGFREIFSADDIKKQFADLNFHHQFSTNGLILPVWYLKKVFVTFDNSKLNFLNQFKDINELLKEKQIDITIDNLSKLIEINKLLLDDFSRINIKYIHKQSKNKLEYSLSKIIDTQDKINFNFIEISQLAMLST